MTRDGSLLAANPHRLVRASAGSGKTHRLALRYLEILFSGGKPESIVAATFTREAAGEILGRVLTRLAAAAEDGGEARRLGQEIGRPELSRRQAELALRAVCEALDRVVVSTLDSFFFRLTAALRFELGLHGVPAVAALDDPLLGALREEALEATLAALAERDWRELVDLFDRLHAGAALRSVARSLDALLLELYEIYLEAPAPELWGRLAAPAKVDAPALASALDALEAALRASAPGALRKALAADLELARRGEWERLLERGLAGKVAADPRAPRYGQTAIPAPWLAALSLVVAHARGAVLGGQVSRTRATHRLLAAFHQHYWDLRRGRGVLLFGDLAGGLARWLPARSAAALEEIYYRIDARVGHLLLDEFQDTSLAQWSVLRPIAEEIRAWGDGSRTFFCVGDPKQAIYGWRGGCADLFDQIEQDLALEPGSGERLEESFRSSQVVLDAVNLVFGGLAEVEALAEHAGSVSRWTAAFGPQRARAALPGYVELVESPATDDHVEWAARRVGRLAAALDGASIAVLAHTNAEAGAMLDALRRGGVVASGEGAGAVADDPAVAAVIAALVLADHPGDSIAAFHVAGCPLGPVVGLRSRERGEVLAASRRLRQAFVERGGGDLLAEWKRALAPACDRRSALRLAQAVDLAERFDREGGGRPGELATYLSRAVVESAQRTGVRVMTVHRAKGLEFDAVVLPALDRPLLRGPDAPVYLLRRSPLAPVEAVHRAAPASVRRLAPELEEGFEQERGRRLRDDLSVLYVALTRARLALHLWVEPDAAPEHGDERRGGGQATLSFAAILRATLGERFRPAAGATGSASPAHDPREQKSEQRIGSADGTEAAPGGDVEAASVLYRAGDLGAVGASIAAAGAKARVGRQGVLPWPAVARAVEGRALRPAVAIEDLALVGGLRAAELLAPASPDGGGGAEAGWREVEAILAAGSDAAHRAAGASRPAAADEGSDPVAEPAPPSEVARARAWLLADGRRIERLERRRRFACSIGGTAVGGELPRVWIASAPGVAPRALVGGELAAAPRHAADGSSPAGVVRAPLGKADVLRLAAARALGIAASSRAGETHEIAVLLCGPGSRLLSLPP